MYVSRDDIDRYLIDVKRAIRINRYRIELNGNRQDNLSLFIDYIIDEEKAKNILLSIEVDDFAMLLKNEHAGFEHERLYVFGKDVRLLERIGNAERTVSLYIKINKLERSYVIVVSFHEQKHPIKYYFK